MMRKILIIIFAFVYVGCVNAPKQNYIADFSKAKAGFNDSLFAHFPSSINGEYYIQSTNPDAVRYSNRCGVTLVVRQDSVSVNKLIKTIKDSSVIVKSEDKKLIFVNGFWSEGGGAIFIKYYKKKYDISSCVVIPYFDKLLSSKIKIESTQSGNLKNYDIYIIEAKKGKFLAENNLSFGYGLPEEWRNGYTRGIAINEDKGVVIYWLEMW